MHICTYIGKTRYSNEEISIDILEKVAQANGFTQIDENIAKEVLCG